MEENFYLDDFEQSLQQQANHFKMTPSKRVWQSIYNDRHPGKRWPSIMMSVILVSTIFIIGFFNTSTKQQSPASVNNNTPAEQSKNNITSQLISQNKSLLPEGNPVVASGTSASPASVIAQNTPGRKANGLKSTTHQQEVTQLNNSEIANILPSVAPVNQFTSPHFGQETEPVSQIKNITTPESLSQEAAQITTDITAHNKIFKSDDPVHINNAIVDADLVSYQTRAINSLKNVPVSYSGIFPSKVDRFKGLTITENAEYKNVRRRLSRISFTYYAAPFVSNVVFTGQHMTATNQGPGLTLPQLNQKSATVHKSAALGFEAGAQMNYALNKKLSITAGVQATRSGYNIISNIVHPTLSTLLLQDPESGDVYARNFVTHYGDGNGASPVMLHNYNYQVSVPIGISFNLFSTDKIRFNLAGSLAPSYVLDADAYVLSSDGRNYISVPDLLRKWNLSSNIAPFVSFRSHKFTWNLGPNVRYQWLSSFQNSYTLKQHLIDYGIRLGISR